MAFAHFLHITFLYQERIQNLSVRAQAALKAHIKELIASPRQGRIVIFEGACTGVFGFEDDIDRSSPAFCLPHWTSLHT
jgi:hypothetical protein